MPLERTGFCWNDGLPISKDGLFCNMKCKEAYDRRQRQDSAIKRGKKASYGAAGSTH